MILGQLEQWQGWTWVCPHSLVDTPQYQAFYRQVRRHAEQLWQDDPQLEPREYQVEAAALYSTRRWNLCAGSQGVGKTLIVALLIATLYPHRQRPGLVQVLAPSLLSAYSRWAVDLSRVRALQGRVATIRSKSDLLRARAPIWVYHHDLLATKAPDRRGTTAHYLARRHKPSLLVIDEIHHFKPGNQRTQALQVLRRVSRRCLGLSGTLTDDRLELLHQACQIVYQAGWPYPDVASLRREFGCKEIVRKRDPDELELADRYLDFVALPQLPAYFRTLSRFVHRLSFDQPKVAQSCRVPAAVEHVWECPATPSQRQAQSRLIQQQRDWAEQLVKYGDRAHLVALFQPLLQLCWLPPDGTANPRYQKLLEVVQASERCGVFVSHVETARWLTEHLSQHWPGQVVRLYAQDPQAQPPRLSAEQRRDVLERILYDPSVKVAVLSLQVCAESIDLTSLSDVCYWAIDWSAIQVAQSLSRAVRPGNPRDQVRVHWLVQPGLLDGYQVQLVREKLRASRRLLDYDPYLAPPETVTGDTLQDVLRSLL